MSTHFKHSLKLLGVFAALLLAAYVWFQHRLTGEPPTGTKVLPPAVLPKQDKEEVMFNEKTHTVTVVTPTRTVKKYAKNPTVHLLKNGDVSVDTHVAGFEDALFLGFGYADTGRVFVGGDFAHISRFDVFGAVGWTPDNAKLDVRIFGGIGYNFYSNTSINLGIDPLSLLPDKKAQICAFVSIKF